jgi:hypothetical protein
MRRMRNAVETNERVIFSRPIEQCRECQGPAMMRGHCTNRPERCNPTAGDEAPCSPITDQAIPSGKGSARLRDFRRSRLREIFQTAG